jgi:ATP-dependent DNA helicase RecG
MKPRPRVNPNLAEALKVRLGYRATRNELIKDVLRDYRHIEASGLGVPRKIIRGQLSRPYWLRF